jgi:mandelate racemase
VTLAEKFEHAIAGSELTIKGIEVRKVLTPMPRVFKSAGGQLKHAAVLLIDLHLSGGVTGVSYLFSPRPDMLGSLAEAVSAMAVSIQGMRCDPVAISTFFERQYLLFGGTGVVTMARAGLDMAMWDAIAKDQGKPFYQLLGGTETSIRAYESSGLGLSNAKEVASEAAEFAENGFWEMKVRLGYPTLDQDLEVLEAVRHAVGPDIGLMVDYNQTLTRETALERCQALDPLGLLWIEEPLVAPDLEGAALLAQEIATPVQIGENLFSEIEVNRALTMKSCDLLMPDVMKIGGATDWLIAAEAAQRHGVLVSSHLFPEISAHLLAIIENRHYLEYANWMDAILAAPIRPQNGVVHLSQSPGTGVVWDTVAVEKYLI